MLDKLKDLGFKYSTKSGITISLSDIPVDETKQDVINQTNKNTANFGGIFLIILLFCWI